MHETTRQIDWQAKQPLLVACSFQKICSVEELETLHAGTKSWLSHHRSPAGVEVRKDEVLDIFLERMRKGHYQSVQD